MEENVVTDLENLHFLQYQLLCLQVVSRQDNHFLDRPPICSVRVRTQINSDPLNYIHLYYLYLNISKKNCVLN